jgi:phosphohistidine swiveling domain-containing protein
MKIHFKKNILLLFLIFFIASANAQSIKLLAENKNTSLRGLSAVNERIIWVSGSNGTVGKSVDSGHTWHWMTVNGFEKTDFRDIEAFDETSAVIMGIGEPAYILRTADGGSTWKVVYENKTKGMFLDAMEFWNLMSGIVIGDPVNGKIFIARTFDGGMHWRELPADNYPRADSGEAMFASSGTNIRKLTNEEAVFVTGGTKSRLFIRDKKIDLPVVQGRESTGANSIAVKNKKVMVIVGGDFNAKDSVDKNCVITSDGGTSFQYPAVPPHGYRSCVEYLEKDKWLSCGLNGIDISYDDGNNWQWLSKEGFHVCRKAKEDKTVFFAGSGGRVAKLVNQ